MPLNAAFFVNACARPEPYESPLCSTATRMSPTTLGSVRRSASTCVSRSASAAAWMSSEGAVRHTRWFDASLVKLMLVAEGEMSSVPPGMVTSVAILIAMPLNAPPTIAGIARSETRYRAARSATSTVP